MQPSEENRDATEWHGNSPKPLPVCDFVLPCVNNSACPIVLVAVFSSRLNAPWSISHAVVGDHDENSFSGKEDIPK